MLNFNLYILDNTLYIIINVIYLFYYNYLKITLIN